jgi:prepilin-type N-terminal cleavage/methylation domain-containing protein
MNPAFFPSKRQPRRALQRAFTLIEIMIVVAIVAILSAIAIPSYQEYVIRGRLTNATNSLAAFRSQMERHFQDNRQYTDAAGFQSPCNAAQLTTLNATLVPQNVTIACPALTANTYTASATGSGVIAGFTFTITDTNIQATTAAPTGWLTSASRWCVKKGCA